METTKLGKYELVKRVAKLTGFRQTDIDEVLGALITVISESLEEGYAITLQNLGTFSTKLVKDRIVRDNMSGKRYFSDAHYAPKFRPSPTLFNRIAYKDKTREETIRLIEGNKLE
jgi:DNA-binding protein HU-beta